MRSWIEKGKRVVGKRMKMLIAGLLALIFLVSAAAPGGLLWDFRRRDEETDVGETAPVIVEAATPEVTPQAAETPAGETPAAAPVEDTAQAEETSGSFSLLLQASRSAAEQGDYEQALQSARSCLLAAETEQDRLLGLAQEGNVLFSLREYAAAETCFRTLLTDNSALRLFAPGAVCDMLARCVLLQDRPDEAIVLCTEGIALSAEEDETLAGLYALRGTSRMSAGDYAAAQDDYQTALGLGYSDAALLEEEIARCENLLADPAPEEQTSVPAASADAWELEAVSAYLSGSYAQAAENYEKLLGRGGSFTDAQLYASIAKCRLMLSQYDSAAESCQKGIAMGESAELGTLYALLGTAYMGKGENAAAAESFETALSSGYGDRENLLTQAAACHYFNGSYADCLRCAEQIAEGNAGSEAMLWAALSRYALGEYSAAASLLEQCMGISQNYCETAELYRILSLCRFLTGDNAAAERAASDGLAVSAESEPALCAELYALRGSSRLSSGDDAAAGDFQCAADCGNTGLYDVYRQTALWEFQRGDYGGTVRAGELALQNGEGTGELYYMLGLSYLSLEQYSAAQEMLVHCETLSPGTENLSFYIGVCCFSLEDFRTAIGYFTASVDRGESQAPRSLYNRGLCYLQLENYEMGMQDVRAAAEQTESPAVAADAAALLCSLQDIL